jgi:serine/threonine protein kinase
LARNKNPAVISLPDQQFREIEHHTNVLKFVGVDKNLSLLTEFCENGSLQSYIFSDKAISVSEIHNIIHGIINGMYHLHTCGILHRDLAARNVLLGKNNQPKISDFGMAVLKSNNKKFDFAPLRHTSPESLQTGIWSEKSDGNR